MKKSVALVEQPETGLADIISRIVADQDNERLRSFTALLNSFNYATQIQAGRVQWEPKDFRLFAIALTAMDQIGQAEQPTEKAAKDQAILHAVETAAQNNTSDTQASQRLREV